MMLSGCLWKRVLRIPVVFLPWIFRGRMPQKLSQRLKRRFFRWAHWFRNYFACFYNPSHKIHCL